MHPIHVGPLQLMKRRRLVLGTTLGLLACAAMLSSCAGSRETRLQLTQHKTMSQTVPLAQDDLNILVDLARNDIAARLHVPQKEITVESTEPLSFPSARAGAGAPPPPGYTIHLTARGQLYEYAGRPLGDTYVLWREIQ